MTQSEWDAARSALLESYTQEGVRFSDAFVASYRMCAALNGPRPEGDEGPPFWFKLAPILGVSMESLTSVWTWFNGRKLFLVAVLTALPVMIDAIGDCVLAFAGAPVPTWDKIAYATLSAVAIGHRVLKVVGVAETPTK
jgi:hypothetical protein